MKKLLIIHKIRICAGLVLGVLFFLYFFSRGSFSFFTWYDRSLAVIGKTLTSVQFIPSLIGTFSGLVISIFIFLSILFFTFMFGRVYCAALCPLGLFQDAGFFAGRFFRKSVRKIKGLRFLWYGIAVIFIVLCFAGFVNAVGFFDPYSIFGKMTTYGLRPAALWAYNLIGSFFDWMGYYLVKPVANTGLLAVYTFIAGFFAAGIFALAAFRGRLFCNILCPVGAILGIISRFSFYKVRITSACVSCGKCQAVCRGGCIDVPAFSVDNSRCVRCLDCAAVCSSSAIGLQRFGNKPSDDLSIGNDSSVSRRNALSIAAAAVFSLMIPRQLFASVSFYSFSRFPFPPGAGTRSHFTKLCTGCGLCSAKCPTGVIRPAFTEKGLSGFMQPLLDYGKGFCEYGCTVCSAVCPTGALQVLLTQKKKTLSIGQTNFVQSRCVVQTDHTACGACAEVCPTHAVTMKPFEDGLAIPVTDTSICIGCGACEFQCPVRPARAIYVSGRDVQIDVHQAIVKEDATPVPKPKEGKKIKKKAEGDFPF